jgi:tetratricopeptide (TPR) repeat protein
LRRTVEAAATDVSSDVTAVESVVSPSMPSSAVLTDRERRVVSVVVAARSALGGAGEDGQTLRAEADSHFVENEAALQEIARRYGARLEVLPVAIVSVLSGRGSATDRAAAGARLSLALRDVLGDVPVALATGHTELGARRPRASGAGERVIGDVIDRAVARVVAPRAGDERRAVWIDETTAGLLGPTFAVRATAVGLELVGERKADMQVRTLLGKPTPCVGRDRELAFLDATLAECEADDVARAVVVLGPAGMGKSRLRYEWMRRLGERGVEVWTARADPMTAGAPFSLAEQLVRRAAALDPAESADATRARLRARLSRHVHEDEKLRRIAEFLGEIVGARFEDEGRIQLHAARRDPLLMNDQIRRAFEDWVGAEAGAAPLVVVLEDLHWGDLPSVQLIDWALAAHADLPLMVLALARPEVKESFPDLWRARGPLELSLGELTPKAGARLARHVLGPDAPDATIERAVSRAAGNAFFLEEILRAVAEGRGDDVPDTVLAMVQRRLEALAPEARRVLRGASAFGETFWRSAVMAQVDDGTSPVSRVDGRLSDLVASELVTARTTSRFGGEQELVFRHAIVREAAYAMLTDDDRALAHRVAGAWLESRGERDAAVLAEHFERGREPIRAAAHYARAAAQALEGNDLVRVLDCAERGVALGAAGPVLGELRRFQAEALRWRGRIAESEACAREATSLLEPGTPSWHTAVAELGTSAASLAHVDVLLAAHADLLAHGRSTEPDFAVALARIVFQLFAAGERTLADATLERLEALDRDNTSPVAHARIEQARSLRALYTGDHGTYYDKMKSVRALFDLVGDRKNACVQAGNMAYVAIVLGVLDEAEEMLSSVMKLAEALGLKRIRAVLQQNMGFLRAEQGRHAETITLQREAIRTFDAQGDARFGAFARIHLSRALSATGDVAGAFVEAELAVDKSAPMAPVHASSLANLADLELRHGRDVDAALAHSTEAYEVMERLGGLEDLEMLVRVAHCEAQGAAGRTDEARETARKAVAAIEARARAIASERFRESFRRTPENARAFALAARLGATAASR